MKQICYTKSRACHAHLEKTRNPIIKFGRNQLIKILLPLWMGLLAFSAGAQSNTISGWVYRDFNGDGVFQSFEQGQATIVIQLYKDNNNNGIKDGGDTFEDSTGTVADGRYQFTGVGSGNFVLYIRPSYLPPAFTYTTGQYQTASFSSSSGGSAVNKNFGYYGEAVACIVIDDDGSGKLAWVNRYNGYYYILPTPLHDPDDIAFHPSGDTILFPDDLESSGGVRKLAGVNRFNGSSTYLANTYGTTSNGPCGYRSLGGGPGAKDIEAFTFDPQTNLLYLVEENAGCNGSPRRDIMFIVNDTTGQFRPGLFTSGYDYIELSGTGSSDIRGIAVHPTTGVMYGISSNKLITINKSTGVTTFVAYVASSSRGLAFATDGKMYGTWNDKFFEIHYTSSSSTRPITIIQYLPGNDYEGCSCISGDSRDLCLAFNAHAVPTDPSCYGVNDGSVMADPLFGVPPYTYVWSTGATTQTISNLSPGTYAVTATDALGCVDADTVSIAYPSVLSVSGTTTDLTCSGIVDSTQLPCSCSGKMVTLTLLYNGPNNVTINCYKESSHSTLIQSFSNVQSGDFLTFDATTIGLSTFASSTYFEIVGVNSNICIHTSCSQYIYGQTFGGHLTATAWTSASSPECNPGYWNGKIDITPAGGTPPYTYQWSNGLSFEDIGGLDVGTYTVTVTDDNGCEATNSFTINQAPAPNISIIGSATNSACNAIDSTQLPCQCDGKMNTITLLYNGPNGVTIKAWRESGHSNLYQSIANVNAGDVITFSSSAGGYSTFGSNTYFEVVGVINNIKIHTSCSQYVYGQTYNNLTVVGYTSPSAPACNPGYCDGSLSVSASGGTAPYSFNWSNGMSGQSIYGLCPGTYTVTVTDANGCSETASFSVGENNCPPEEWEFDCTDGVTVGMIGTGTNAASSTTLQIPDLATVDSIVVEVVFKGNPVPTSVTFTSPVETVTVNTPIGVINGSSDKGVFRALMQPADSITATTSNAWSFIAYVFRSGTANPQPGAGVFTNVYLYHNTYTYNLALPVTPGPKNVIIELPITELNYDSRIVQISATAGSVSNSISFNHPNLGSSLNITPFTLTNVPGSVNTISVTVTSPNSGGDSFLAGVLTRIESCCTNSPEISGTVQNISCHGLSDGAINISVSNGTPPFTYNWSNGATTEDISGLGVGNYTVTVVDSLGCRDTATFAITQPPQALSANCSNTPVSCYGGSDGTASVIPSGGTPGYSYNWSNGGSTATITGLSAGTYTVTVTDANGCQATCSTTVTQPNQSLSANCSNTPVSCYGGSDGTASVTPSGGTPGYSYNWSNGGSTATITGLSAGTYTVTVTDANGCQATCSTTVTQPNQSLSANCSNTPVSCYGGTDGTASVTPSGGTPGYSYNWSNGGSTATITGLSAGTYTVTVTDANGCQATCSTTVTQPNQSLSANCSNTPVSCYGGTDGTASVTPSGGTPGYSYNWSNGGSTATITGLSAGTYTVTVTDANGCQATCSTTVTQPNQSLSANCSNTPVSCYGGSDGTASVTPSGGTPGYSYNWSNGGSTATITGLSAGTYTVTVTDANGCQATCSTTVTQPNQNLSANCSNTPVSCYGGTDGTASVTPSGGTPGYSYNWSNGASTSTITGLSAGTYTVTVTDVNGCQATCSTTVTQPQQALSANCSNTPVSCYGGSDGTASVTPSGGTPGYSYNWSNGGSTATITGLSAGTYTVTVTDANGCQATCSTTVTQPQQALSANCSNTPVSCYGGSDGTASVTPSGGTPGYSYNWSNGGSTATITGLSAGTYTVTVTDANGCQATCSTTVTQPQQALSANCSNTPVSCYGGTDGTASVTPSGGTPGYSYNWSNGGSTATITGLSAGTYTVTVTDANGCQATCSTTVTQPQQALSANCSNTPVSCYGGSDGTASVTPSGGTPPYTYAWSNGGTTQTITGLSTGLYFVVVTDANGCVDYCYTFVTQPPLPLNVSCTSTPVSCFGGSNGTATVFPSGGTPPYTYAWSNGATTPTITGLSSGLYFVVVTDANGCVDYCYTFVTQPPAPLYAFCNSTPVSCYGGSNGTASVTPSGGTPPYSYLWSNGGTTSSISGLTAGTYSVVVTDANGCITSCSTTVTQPQQALSASCTNTPVSCYGGSDGTATATPSGGTPPYSYAWSNGGSTSTISGLSIGWYSVTITDINGCTAVCSTLITQPTPLNVGPVVIHPTCAVGNNGSISLVVVGGTPPYTYNWSNGATSSSITNLIPGVYSVIVSDANGCIYQNTWTLVPTGGLTVQGNVNHVTCFGYTNGSVNITVVNGTAPYSYSWSNGATTQNISGLSAGSYSVTVTDAYGCIGTKTFVVNQPPLLVVNETVTNVDCYGNATGSIFLTVSGGTPGYSFIWSNGVVTQNISGLTAGSYTVTVTDQNQCQVIKTIHVGQPSQLTATQTVSHVTCSDSCNGSILMHPSGGTPPYTYTWLHGDSTQSISNLCPGAYTVEIRDANNCYITKTIIISAPQPIYISATPVHVSCNGYCNGSIFVNPIGGTPPFTFSWSNGSTSKDIFNLCAGSYTVTVTDSNGCTVSETVVISQPNVLDVTGIVTDAGCDSLCNGAISGSASGGTPPYTYAWSNGQSTSSISNLCYGQYSVTVTDANGCIDSASFTVQGSPPIHITNATITHVSCYGYSDGAINITVAGGIPPFTFAWSNGANTEDISGLNVGWYSVTITDDYGCQKTDSFQIVQPPVLTATATVVGESCLGSADGAIDVTVSGGTPPYSFAWSNGATTEDISGLVAGTYTVTITDQNSCTYILTKTIHRIPGIAISGIVSDVTCFGGSNGAINITVSGGVAPYTYLWSNGATTEDISGLSEGLYSVQVTDAAGCKKTAYFAVTFQYKLSSQVAVVDPQCGNNDGSIDLTVSGGTGHYLYSWSNGATTEDLSGLSAGSYFVSITDSVSGCIVTDSVTLENVGGPTLSAVITASGCAANTGMIDLSVAGGSGSYSYQWSNGNTTQDISGLASGWYHVTVTDNVSGCKAVKRYFVPLVNNLAITGNVTPATCQMSNGAITITVQWGSGFYSYLWSNGATTKDISNISGGHYSVTVTDLVSGCIKSASFDVAEIGGPVVNLSVSPVSCAGYSDGSITANASGGSGVYYYFWSNGATTQTISGLSYGHYVVMVVDSATGCFTYKSAFVPTPRPLDIYADRHHTTCNGASDGSIYLTVVGGTSPYTYAWSNGATTAAITNLSAGIYSATVTDAQNCTNTITLDIQDTIYVVASAVVSDVSCLNGSDGSIDLSVSGGKPPYTYSWSNGANTEDLSNIMAGTYSVTVSDINGCSDTLTVVVSTIPGMNLSATLTHIDCEAATQGSIDVSVTGGTLPYSYQWSNGANTEDIYGLSSGIYHLTVTDANGCTLVRTFTIQYFNNLDLQWAVINSSCGNSDGRINLTVQGGSGHYVYAWSNAATTEDISNLPAEQYVVIVTDSVTGCVATDTIIVEDVLGPDLSAVVYDANCIGYGGSIDLTVTGGSGNYTYDWSNLFVTQDISNLSPGTYTVSVTDNITGCKSIATYYVGTNSNLVLNGTVVNASCGMANGSVSVTVGLGSGFYSYAWSNGSNTATISGLPAGSYELTVTDMFTFCEATAIYHISETGGPVVDSAVVSDVTCITAANGTIQLHVSGGSGIYHYQWSNGASGASISGLHAGLYMVTITDSVSGCMTTGSWSVIEPDPLNLIIDRLHVSCQGFDDGSIDLTVLGGTQPYAYSWSNGATTEDLSQLGAGIYTIVVTDANQCTNTIDVDVQDTIALNLSAITTNVNCEGGSDGSIDLTVTGGTTPYTYAWSNGATSEDLNNVSAGVYSVIVTDANGCSDTLTVTVHQTPGIQVQATLSNPNCGNGSTGSIQLAISGGTAPYSYQWSNGAITKDIYGLSAGVYAVTVTDINGCQQFGLYTISTGAPLDLQWTVINSLCGNADGEIDLKVLGGSGSYYYYWSNGATTQDLTNLLPEVYIVSVIDSVTGCTSVDTIIVEDVQGVDISGITTDANCSGTGGAIDITVTGGSGNYIFDWSNYHITEDINNLSAGVYTVTVTDTVSGCISIASFHVGLNNNLLLMASLTDAGCGQSNGAINLTVGFGSGIYNYTWSNGATTEDISGLAAGVYSITVVDIITGCTKSSLFVIGETGGPFVSALETHISCTTAGDGAIDLTVSGGSGTYFYNWSNGATSEDLTNLYKGTYIVHVTDSATGCQTVMMFDIMEPTPVNLILDRLHASCYGAQDGSIVTTALGGTPPYSYAWNTGASTNQISGLGSGNYTITVTDANGCTNTGAVSVNQPDSIAVTASITSAGCNGQGGGAIALNVSGGTAPYSYAWSTGDTGQHLVNLTSGNYSVTVTDANGCMDISSFFVPATPDLLISGLVSHVVCQGGSTGMIDLTVHNGSGSYSYYWSNGAITEDLAGLSSGLYIVMVTDDSTGCMATEAFTVLEGNLAIIFADINPSCGNNNGESHVTVSGGSGHYSYAWSNGASGAAITGLGAGTYSLTVTDNVTGCTAIANTSLSNTAGPIVSGTVTDATHCGAGNGSIDITVITGSGNYSFAWSNGATTEDVFGLSFGSYCVSVTDLSTGCITIACFDVDETNSLLLTSSVVDAACGMSNGSIDLVVSGGTGNYTYQWSNGANTEDISGLLAGVYQVTVTDLVSACSARYIVLVSNAQGPQLTLVTSDITCNASADGSINLTVSGGSGSYLFSWSNGASSEDLSGLGVGTYLVKVTDSITGCIALGQATISQPDELHIVADRSHVSCYGNCDGTIAVQAFGGTPGYSYAWSNNSTSTHISNLCGGTYTVSVTDNNGCVAVLDVLINEPQQIVITVDSTSDASCPGNNDGSITVSASGGTIPYSYMLGNVIQNHGHFTGLTAGTYTIIVFDANECADSISVSIGNSAALHLSGIISNVTCDDGSNGAINLTVSNGSGNYSYYWSNGATTEDISNLTPGAYFVQVTDNVSGCEGTAFFTIVDPTLAVATAVVNAGCGQSDGEIYLTVAGGSGHYIYSWSNGGTGQSQTGLSSGSYSISITDTVTGCAVVEVVSVDHVGGPDITSVITDANGCGASNGSIDITVIGNSTYTYLWSNNATTQDLTGITAGTYKVTVTDQVTGCVTIAEFNVGETNNLQLTASVTDANCGAANGSIDLIVSGGTGTYAYNWSNGATSEDLSGLSAGIYMVTVTDANSNCVATLMVIVNETGGPAVNATATAISCTGAADGSINLTVSGGSGAYTYLWSNGASTQHLTGLYKGTYLVQVTDSATGCMTFASALITEPTVIDLVADRTHISCFGNCDGSIDLSVSGGTSGYSYAWSSGATSQDIQGLCAGTYTVSVTDANGCVNTVAIAINQSQALVLSVDSTANVTCSGNMDGYIAVSTVGGAMPYTYYLNGTAQQGNTYTNLPGGTYTIIVVDNNGCSDTATVVLSSNAGLELAASITHINCFNGSNGAIQLTVSQGSGNYTYYWSNGAITQNIANLSAGNYFVYVTDVVTGCTASGNYTVVDSSLSVATGVINASCGNSDGEINLTVSGGSGSFSYNWSNIGPGSSSQTGLSAGTYSITITDLVTGCMIIETLTIENTNGPNLFGVVTDASKCGASDGSIDLTVIGASVYTYQWSNNAQTQDIGGLSAGMYSVTVTDTVTGCVSIATFNVGESNSLILTANVTDATCGGNDGVIDLVVTGGTGSYIYQWSTGAVTQDISGIPAGAYAVTVTDAASSCTATLIITVNDIGGPVVSLTITQVNCASANDATVTTSVSGGSGTYTYAWSHGATTQNLSNLGPGTYIVAVTDSATGCTAFASATITEPTVIDLVIDKTDVTCHGAMNGSIDLTVSGGTGAYTYAWSNGPTSQDQLNIAGGVYTVTVTDANGCSNTLTVTIHEPATLAISLVSDMDANCNGSADGYIDVATTGGTPPYMYSINGSQPDTISYFGNLTSGVYTILVTDANGCVDSLVDTLDSQGGLIVSGVVGHVLCDHGSTGSISLTVSGGSGSYQYYWSNGSTTKDLVNLPAGVYIVNITDSVNGCMTSDVFTVVDSSIAVSTVVVNAICGAFSNTGSIDITVSGGSGNFSYLWNDSQNSTTEDLSGLSAGSYTVTVTDNSTQCVVIVTAYVDYSDGPQIQGVVTNASCGASNGSIDITVTGGTIPYTFVWSNGAQAEDVSNLAAGTYTVIVTDSFGFGCTSVATFTVLDDNELTISGVVSNASCGLSDGAIDITIGFGSGNFSFSWSTGATTEDITGLPAGTYSVTVADNVTDCSIVGIFTVSDIGGPVITLDNLDDESCAGSNDGLIDISVSGGSGTYAYDWSHGATTQDISGLPAGTYIVMVTDMASGCISFAEFTIEAAIPMHAMADVVPDICDPGNVPLLGAIDLSVKGGVAPYTFAWNTGATTEDLIGIEEGTYTVTITDARGCVLIAQVTVPCIPEEVFGCEYKIPNAFTPNGDGVNDGLLIEGYSDAECPAQVWVFNRWGDLVYHANPYDNNNPWRGQLLDTEQLVPDGTYYYVVESYEGDKQFKGFIVIQR